MAANIRMSTPVPAWAARFIPGRLALPIVVLATSYAWWLLWSFDYSVASEGRLMEWGQAGFLVAAAAVLIGHLRSRPGLEDRLAWWGLSLLFLSLASREIEMRLLSRTQPVLMTEKGLRVLLAVAWVWYGFRAVPRWPEMLRYLRPFLSSRTGLLFMAGAGLYLFSWFFDKNHRIPFLTRQFVEELIEFHATFLMLCAALLAQPLKTQSEPAITRSEAA
jgi:hypothetical protein